MTSLWLMIPLVIVSVLGVIVNAYILLVVLFSRQAASANNLLLLHLGALDVLLGIIFLSFTAPGLTKTSWLSSGAPCYIHGFLFTLLHPLVLWTICGLNADRYYAIAAPLHYGHLVSPKKVLACLGIGWFISLIMCIPPFFLVAPYTFNSGLGACIPDFSSGYGALWYSTIYTAFTLLLPITLIICCNIKILMIARYHRHRIASAIYEVTLSAQVTITHQRNPFFVPTVTAPSAGGPKFRSRSPVSNLIQLLGSCILIYLPYYTTILCESSATLLRNPHSKLLPLQIYQLVLILLTCSPSVNGFLYGLKNKLLRKSFQNYWRKKIQKSEVNQEIQARTPSTCGSRRQSLTPLGFFTRPNIPRRSSEAILDVHKVIHSPTKPKIKRIASEITWRPSSSGALNYSPNEERKRLPQASSCNTLQVPKCDPEEVSVIINDVLPLKSKQLTNRPNLSSANLLLQKFFGLEAHEQQKNAFAIKTMLDTSPKRSPRILITRAFSEDSDKTYSQPNTPTKDLHKKHSASTTTLLEKKWRQMRFKENEYDSDDLNSKTKPLLDHTSDSSETSETSSGLYMNLDLATKGVNMNGDITKMPLLGKDNSEQNLEGQALLSWPNNEDKLWPNSKFLEQTLVNVQSEVVL